uniref:Uncharacterized protein n=1 Tax=Arundo donax TaxID=35708 RepID=A0A0A9H1Z3_ARUDO
MLVRLLCSSVLSCQNVFMDDSNNCTCLDFLSCLLYLNYEL